MISQTPCRLEVEAPLLVKVVVCTIISDGPAGPKKAACSSLGPFNELLASALNNNRNALSSADAHGGQTVAAAAAT